MQPSEKKLLSDIDTQILLHELTLIRECYTVVTLAKDEGLIDLAVSLVSSEAVDQIVVRLRTLLNRLEKAHRLRTLLNRLEKAQEQPKCQH